jgi:hypothetical protein
LYTERAVHYVPIDKAITQQLRTNTLLIYRF